MSKRLTQEEVIARFKNVHGDRYDYSKVEYKGRTKKVRIVCSIHGDFWIRPSDHWNGVGCVKCAGLAKMTTEDFIEKARLVHGNKYDYSKSEYINYHTDICIICPIHGEFWQSPKVHLQGCGCKDCRDDSYRLTTEEFIRRARMVWGNRFDFSKTEYKGMEIPIIVGCPIHGFVSVSPHSFLQGHGCKLCKFESQKNLICGHGINDLLKESASKSYNVWQSLMERTSPTIKRRKGLESYSDSTVCPEWETYSVFKQWYESNYFEGCEIDKDILFKGNKHYSPATCCLVPHEINMLLARCNKGNGHYPMGVSRYKDKFRAQFYHTHIGYYNTVEDAFYAYKQVKEKNIRDKAKEYYDKGVINEQVYNALINYEIEMY